MSIFRTLLGLPERRSESEVQSVWYQGGDISSLISSSNLRVTQETAEAIAAFDAGVRIIAESIGTLPADLYVPTKDGRGRKPAENAPEYTMLKTRPNEDDSPVEFWESWITSAIYRGDAMAPIARRDDGHAESWRIVPADEVAVRRIAGRLVYDTPDQDVPGKRRYLFKGDGIAHLKMKSKDGVRGRGVLQMHKDTLGLALAQQTFEAAIYKNGARPNGVLTTDEDMDENQAQEVQRLWNAQHEGVSKWFKTAVLPYKLKYSPITMSLEDLEHIVNRKLTIADIARILRVPLHLLQELDRATFSNIEYQSMEFVIHTLRPWCVRTEQTVNSQVLLDAQRRKGFYFKFNLNGLLRGAQKERYEAYASAIQNGWMTRNEARMWEELDAMEGLDVFLVPLNMAELGKEDDAKEAQDAKKEPQKDEKTPKNEQKPEKKGIETVLSSVIADELTRITRKWTTAIHRNLGKMRASEFEEWMTDYSLEMAGFYQTRMSEAVGKAVDALGVEVEESVIRHRQILLADCFASRLRSQISDALGRFNGDWQKMARAIEPDSYNTFAQEQAQREIDWILSVKGEANVA